MSMWGDNNWRQRILEDTQYHMRDQNMDPITAAKGLCDIAAYLLNTGISRDEELKKIYERAKQDAKREIMSRING